MYKTSHVEEMMSQVPLKGSISVKLSEKHIVHTELYMHESKHVW